MTTVVDAAVSSRRAAAKPVMMTPSVEIPTALAIPVWTCTCMESVKLVVERPVKVSLVDADAIAAADEQGVVASVMPHCWAVLATIAKAKLGMPLPVKAGPENMAVP